MNCVISVLISVYGIHCGYFHYLSALFLCIVSYQCKYLYVAFIVSIFSRRQYCYALRHMSMYCISVCGIHRRPSVLPPGGIVSDAFEVDNVDEECNDESNATKEMTYKALSSMGSIENSCQKQQQEHGQHENEEQLLLPHQAQQLHQPQQQPQQAQQLHQPQQQQQHRPSIWEKEDAYAGLISMAPSSVKANDDIIMPPKAPTCQKTLRNGNPDVDDNYLMIKQNSETAEMNCSATGV